MQEDQHIVSLINSRDEKDHMEKRHYSKRAPQPAVTMSTLVDLVDMIEKPEGVNKINTKLFSISFTQLRLSTRTCSGVNKL